LFVNLDIAAEDETELRDSTKVHEQFHRPMRIDTPEITAEIPTSCFKFMTE
jgi:hypothetical protein